MSYIEIAGDLYIFEANEQLAYQVRSTYNTTEREIEINLRNVRIVNSFAIQTLITVQRECMQANKVLILTHVHGVVLRIMRALRLDQIVSLREG